MRNWTQDYSEEELDFIEAEMDVKFMPWQEKKREFGLENYVYNAIRRDLRQKYPLTAAYTSNERLRSFAKEIAEKIGFYQITVMPYEALSQSYAVQGYRINPVVGEMRKDGFFALIDERTRQVGVYIPKSRRLLKLEQKVEQALCALDKHITSTGGNPNLTIRTALETFLLEQRHPEKLLPIRIVAVSHKINDERSVFLPKVGKLQLRFKIFEKEEVLYYHIVR